MLKIIKPSVGLHDGSSFREVLDMWDDLGLCKVVPGNIPEKPWKREETQLIESRPWALGIGKIMLYDNPILDKLHDDLSWELALWSNTVKKDEKSSSWIFWPKHIKKYTKFLNDTGIKSYEDRFYESVFIGSFTTQKRSGNWNSSIQNFWMGHPNQRLFHHEKYLEFLSLHKFGLCLPGVGPKCLRDIELIGMGTVPIFTPGVCSDYYNGLIEGEHYLYAEKPKDIPDIIKNCSKDKWKHISNNCLAWYEENCSPVGSFKTTAKIIQEKYES